MPANGYNHSDRGSKKKSNDGHSALCKIAGKDIPIYPGCEKPLLVTQKQTHAPQASALDRWKHDTRFPEGEAIEFLRSNIRKYPGEITLLAIGPLTNIGLLFASDPEIPSLLKALVLMCGVFTNSLAGVGSLEWNAIGDPHAAAIVYNSAAKIHRSIGLDVTFHVDMDSAQVKERFRHDLLIPVMDFAEVWFRSYHQKTVIFHDPLAAASIFDDGVCSFEKGNVSVELASECLKGYTYWKPDSEGLHEVALGVNQDRFFQHYFLRKD